MLRWTFEFRKDTNKTLIYRTITEIPMNFQEYLYFDFNPSTKICAEHNGHVRATILNIRDPSPLRYFLEKKAFASELLDSREVSLFIVRTRFTPDRFPDY